MLFIFFHCSFATQVWNLAPIKQTFHTTEHDTLSSAIRESLTLICLPPTGLLVNISSWICWYLWSARNLLVFENRHVTARTTISSALSSAREWQAAQHYDTVPRSPSLTPPEPHNEGPFAVLCNSDAAWSKETETAGLGWMFDGPAPAARQCMSTTRHAVSSPLMAEALAMREALQAAKQGLLSNVWFRTDSQELVRAINSKSFSVELYGVLSDIEFLSRSFISVLFSYVPRSQNLIADSLAKNALRSAATLY